MRVKGITVQQFILGLALLAALCWNLAHANEISHLALSEGPTGTRAELQLKSEASFRTLSLANPDRFVVDLPDTAAGAHLQLPAPAGVVRAVRRGQPAPGTLRIVFDLAQPVVPMKPRLERSPDGAVRLVLEWPGDGAVAAALLTGQPPATLASVLATPSAVPQPANDLVLSIPAETLRQRPDVRAAEYQVTAAAARVAQADAALLPNFQLGGSLGLSALTLGALGSGSSVVSVLLASVSLPVFEGGALRAQVRAQQAALDAARSAYEATVLAALKDVEDALVALRANRERLTYLQRAAAAAGNAALLARQRYASGLIDFQTVLDTQRTQLAAQDSVASTGTLLAADHVRLYKALGGGWRAADQDAPPALLADTPRSTQ